MKRKIFTIISSITLSLTLLTSCTGTDTPANSADTTSTTSQNTSSASTTANTTQASTNTITFDAMTVEDEAITSDIFKDYKITMINIWATWCGPCLAEMPDLATLHGELPEGSNLIGFVLDAGDDESTKQSALDLLADMNITYKNIIPDKNIADYVNKNITGIPTSIFVDKDGNIIGSPAIGAPRDDVVGGYKKIIEERIAMLGE